MASTLVLLLHLLLVSLVSTSHYFGGSAGFTYKGRNPNGTFRVESRYKNTFDGCNHYLHWHCGSPSCSNITGSSTGVIDHSNNAQSSTRKWCETETVNTRLLLSDKPFQTKASSCCWIRTRNSVSSWKLLTSVDLGRRSDTGNPNRSPDVSILPFLRVPQNCPRTYALMSFDPDGDHVRCRYGNLTNGECSRCNQPPGFILDQDSCTLHYNFSHAEARAYAFEMVVEDFPRENIILSYSDGSQTSKSPPALRRETRSLTNNWWWWPTTTAPTTTTTQWWRWWWPTTTAPTTTTPTTTTQWWRWWPTTTAPTTTTPTTTTQWWRWWHNNTPSTTTTPTTTTQWWRWWHNNTPSTTTTPTTTTQWWGWWHNNTASTTTTPTTTTQWWGWWHNNTASTTTTPTTTTQWWGWWHNNTPSTTTTPTTTTQWWGWWHNNTASTTTTTTSTTTNQAHSTTTSTYVHTKSRQHVTDPLSKLPLQFSFLVDPPVPSCQEGYYLPKLVPPTPPNGERIQAEVNKEVEIRVKAQALKATIDDIIMTGPLNISKHMTARDEFVIRWTPVPDDQGEHYPVCFAVESKNGYNIYQSEMRCVLLDVVEEKVKTTVICNETTMTVTVEKATFPGVREDNLQLNDPTNTACRLTSNSSHIFAVIPLNACGTQIEEDADNLLFKNEITTVDNTGDLITRKHLLEVQFYCQYRKRENITLGFTVHRDNVTVMEKGFGTFTYGFEFYPTSQFRAMIDPSSYPLEYDIGSRIFMEIEATSAVIDTDLFVESCSAAPYDIPNYTPTYPIIKNGCKMDSTVEIHPSNNSRHFKFSLEAFKFIGLHDQVYIHCSVMMCKAGEPGTRCSQGCTNSTNWQSRGSFSHRGKREAVSQTSMHFISQGPLRLRRSAELTGNPVMNPNLNLNLVLIAGCVLAAVAMISAVVMYKAKISKGGYQPLATAES